MDMEKHTVKSPSASPSPFPAVTHVLQAAQDQDTVITMPHKIGQHVKQYIATHHTTPVQEVETVVKAAEQIGPEGLSRLDAFAFGTIFGVLRVSEACLAQQRGLCLLTESLQMGHMSPSQSDLKFKKKTEIGAQILDTLLRKFTRKGQDHHFRRWVGLLLLELLKDCADNRQRLEVAIEGTRRSLGDIVANSKCEVLKLIAGSIIREMVGHGVPEENFWPIDTETQVFANFPKSQRHTSQWVGNFQIYLDEIYSQQRSKHESRDINRNRVMFAYAASVGKSNYSVEDRPAILVSLAEEMNIVVPQTSVPAKYIDVQLNNIESVTMKEIPGKTKSTVKLALASKLKGSTFLFNARERSDHSIWIAFDDPDDAQELQDFIEAKQRVFAELPKVSESQVIIDLTQRKPLAVNAEANPSVIPKDDEDPDNLAVTATQAMHALHERSLPTLPGHVGLENGAGILNCQLPTVKESDDNIGSIPASISQQNGTIDYPSKPTMQSKAPDCRKEKDNNTSSDGDKRPAVSPDPPSPDMAAQSKSPVQDELCKRQNSPSPTSETEAKSPVQGKGSPNQKPQESGKASRIVERKPAPVTKMFSTASSSKTIRQHPANDTETEYPDNVDWEEGFSIPQNSPAHVPHRAKGKRAKSRAAAPQITAKKTVRKNTLPITKAETVPVRTRSTKLKSRAKSRHPPAASHKPRSTRAAAIVANSRIQGIDESEAENAEQTAPNALNKKPKNNNSIGQSTPSSGASKLSERDTANPNESLLNAFESSEYAEQVCVGAGNSDMVVRSELHSMPNLRPPDAKSKELQPPKDSDTASRAAQPSEITQGNGSDKAPTAQDSKEIGHQVDKPEAKKPHAIQKSAESYTDELETVEGVGTCQTSTDAQAVIKSNEVARNKLEMEGYSIECHHRNSLIELEADKAAHDHVVRNSAELRNDNFIELRKNDSPAILNGEPPLQQVQGDHIECSADEIEVRNHYFEDAMAFTDHHSDIDEQRYHVTQSLNPISLPLPSGPSSASSTASQTHAEECGPNDMIRSGLDPSETHSESQIKAFKDGNESVLVRDLHADGTKASSTERKTSVAGKRPFVGDTLQKALSAFESVDRDSGSTLKVQKDKQKWAQSAVEARSRSLAPTQLHTHNHKLLRANGGSVSQTQEANPAQNNTRQPEPAHNGEKVAVANPRGGQGRTSLAEDKPKTAAKHHTNASVTPSRRPQGSSQDNAIHITSSREDTSEHSSEDVNSKGSARAPSVIEPVNAESHQKLGAEISNRSRQSSDEGDEENKRLRVPHLKVKFEDTVTLVRDLANDVEQQMTHSKPIPPMAIRVLKETRNPNDIETLDGQTDKRALVGKQAATASMDQRNSLVGGKSKHQQTHAKESVAPRAETKIDTLTSLQATQARNDGHQKGSTKTPADPDRKSTLISFNAKGPRNQGFSSSSKPGAEYSWANSTFNQPKAEAVRVKRKRQVEETDAKSNQRPKLLEKRAKVLVPETVLQVKESFNRRSSSGMALSQKTSSQGTRVTEDGSPMPNPLPSQHRIANDDVIRMIRPASIPKVETPVHDDITLIPSDTNIEVSHRKRATEQSEVDHDLFLQATKHVQTFPRPSMTIASDNKLDHDQNNRMQRTRNQPAKQPKSVVKYNPWAFSSSSKAQPSSPSAPSRMLATMEVYQQESGGKFVNVQTEQIVRAQPPKNPFIGIEHERPTSFMERLRRSSKEITQPHRDAVTSNHAPAHHVWHRSAAHFDPEKTFVEYDPSRQANGFSRYPRYTSSSHSSSTRTTKGSELSGRSENDIEGDTARKWREALRPHQKDTFAALAEINHRVTRDLIDKETAIEDIIQDYERGGTDIIKAAEKDHGQKLLEFRASAETLKRKHEAAFSKLAIEVTKIVKKVQKRPVADFLNHYSTQQRDLRSQIDAALLACRQ